MAESEKHDEPLGEPSLPTNEPEKEITEKMSEVTLSEEKGNVNKSLMVNISLDIKVNTCI